MAVSNAKGGLVVSDLRAQALELMARRDRIGVLATASAAGEPNVGYFSSTVVMDDEVIALGLGNNRSLKNMGENPAAVYFAIETFPVELTTPGFRVYLKVREIQRDGPILHRIREAIRHAAGDVAADNTVAVALFDVTNVRPMIDPLTSP
jgi:hypothetical protein